MIVKLRNQLWEEKVRWWFKLRKRKKTG